MRRTMIRVANARWALLAGDDTMLFTTATIKKRSSA
jgi:hypothetical protein